MNQEKKNKNRPKTNIANGDPVHNLKQVFNLFDNKSLTREKMKPTASRADRLYLNSKFAVVVGAHLSTGRQYFASVPLEPPIEDMYHTNAFFGFHSQINIHQPISFLHSSMGDLMPYFSS
jgi:hypothetical protein